MNDNSEQETKDFLAMVEQEKQRRYQIPDDDEMQRRSEVLQSWIDGALDGDWQDAMALIYQLQLVINAYCPHLPKNFRQYFSDVLGQIHDGHDPKETLHLKGPKKGELQKIREFRQDHRWYLAIKTLMKEKELSFAQALNMYNDSKDKQRQNLCKADFKHCNDIKVLMQKENISLDAALEKYYKTIGMERALPAARLQYNALKAFAQEKKINGLDAAIEEYCSQNIKTILVSNGKEYEMAERRELTRAQKRFNQIEKNIELFSKTYKSYTFPMS